MSGAWSYVDIGLPGDPEVPGLVSVIIPTFNRAAKLREAVQSVRAQTYGNIEIVVADDGSTDDTRAVCEALGVRYVRQDNRGVSAARNLALRHARGEFIAFLDSDDFWLPWKVQAQLAVFNAFPDVGMVWTDMTAVSEAGQLMHERYLRTFYHAYRVVRIEEVLARVATLGDLWSEAPGGARAGSVYSGDLLSWMVIGNLVHTSTVILRRKWLRKVGGFDETLRISGEDYDFHLRTSSLGPVALLDFPSIHYRVGAADQLSQPAKMIHVARNNLSTIVKALDGAGNRISLPPGFLTSRVARAYAWLGAEELSNDNERAARGALVRSLMRRPIQGRTAALLGLALLPRSVRHGALRAYSTARRTMRTRK